MCEKFASNNGEGKFHHINGELSAVRIEAAGLGTKRVRPANMPPEIPDRIIKIVLVRYSQLKEIYAQP
jgi:hypothetical protein